VGVGMAGGAGVGVGMAGEGWITTGVGGGGTWTWIVHPMPAMTKPIRMRMAFKERGLMLDLLFVCSCSPFGNSSLLLLERLWAKPQTSGLIAPMIRRERPQNVFRRKDLLRSWPGG
jgi:hypothetical protein